MGVLGCSKRKPEVRFLLGEGRRKTEGGRRREFGESSRVESHQPVDLGWTEKMLVSDRY